MNKMLALKAFAIAVLTAVILIALAMVGSVIDERQRYRDDAVHSIEASYAGPQGLVGPVLMRPYTQTVITVETGDKGIKRSVPHITQQTAITFPHELEVKGTLAPNERRHGLYKVTVYEFDGKLSGSMQVTDPKTEGTIEWGEPYLALSVADVRGIVGTPKVIVNGSPQTMIQGAPPMSGWQPNLRVPLTGATSLKGPLQFQADITLAGTETLNVAPVGDSNHVELSSVWSSPLFAGQFLPRTRTVSSNGFTAAWDVSSLASGTQVQMVTEGSKAIDMMNVSLLNTVDPYKLSDRATKYGILFVVLTFGGFFMFEMMKQLPIHPVQYLLVGFGLAIFFLLLVSFSEHMAFGASYLISSAACIGLLTFYLTFVLRSMARGLAFGGLLTLLYAAIYGLLISEDNALILGSLMLFLLLAIVMVITRKVDWYKGSAALLQVKTAEARTSVEGVPPPPLEARSN